MNQLMYSSLLFIHSWFRYVVVLVLIGVFFRAWWADRQQLPFSKLDNSLRHNSATIVHLQLILGVVLYVKSPLVQYFWQGEALGASSRFFGSYHALLMILATVFVTLGSAFAKRATEGQQFKTLWRWYGLALLVIFIAIPWPFSPLAERPLFRF